MNQQSLPAPSRPLLILLLLGLLLWLPVLGNRAVWPADEPRFAEVAREMMVTGDYLVPRINLEPYYEKPPLLPWAIVAFSALPGEVTEITTRLPSMCAALLTLACTFLLARRLFDPPTAFWSGLVLLLCQRFWWQGHTGQIDMLLTGCLALSFLSLWNWHELRRPAWRLLFFVGIALGLYAKGPPALLFPLLAVYAFYWKQKQERRALHPWFGTLVAVALILLWLIPARLAASSGLDGAGQTMLLSDLYRQIVGRVVLGVSKAQPPWYYLVNLPSDWFPWALLLPWTALWSWRHRRDGVAMRYLLAWTVPAFIVFSLITGKRAIYLLPIYPAMAILVARSLQDLVAPLRKRWLSVTGGIWGALLLILACAPVVVRFSRYSAYARPELDIFGIFCLILALHMLLRGIGAHAARMPVLMAGHTILLLLFTGVVLFPIIDTFKSAKEICAPARQLQAEGVDFDLVTWGFNREEYLFYSRHTQSFIRPDLEQMLLDDGSFTVESAAAGSRILYATADRQGKAAASFTPRHQEVRTELIQALQTDATLKVTDALLAHLDSGFVDIAQPLFSERPTLLYIQPRDWWLLSAFNPGADALTLIDFRTIGHRSVLLLANPAALRAQQHLTAASS